MKGYHKSITSVFPGVECLRPGAALRNHVRRALQELSSLGDRLAPGRVLNGRGKARREARRRVECHVPQLG